MTKPHFIIAGERRSGSTTLYDILKLHPGITMYPLSDYDYFIEPELFSKNPSASKDKWELNHSAEEFAAIFEDYEGVSGMKDADLLWWKPAHERMARFLPDTKFIFVLREPARRAESQYFNEFSKGRETRTFRQAIKTEEKGGLDDWQRLHLQYKERGCYVNSLRHFFRHIPKERVKVVILEELFGSFREQIKDICDFLGVVSGSGIQLPEKHSNKERTMVRKAYAQKGLGGSIFSAWERGTEAFITRWTRDKTKRQQLRHRWQNFYKESLRDKEHGHSEILKELRTFYQPYNKELEELLGRKINAWETR